MYRFGDTSVAEQYENVPLFHAPVGRNITFARDGKNDGSQYLDVLFRKRQAEIQPGTRLGPGANQPSAEAGLLHA
jgi:hypothetical protein